LVSGTLSTWALTICAVITPAFKTVVETAPLCVPVTVMLLALIKPPERFDIFSFVTLTIILFKE
jgi:hypothetical protein